MACSAIRRPYGEIAQFTRFIEASEIDMPAIVEQAKSKSDMRRRLDRAMAQASGASRRSSSNGVR